MIKFLTALFAVINKLVGAWNEQRWKKQGRQEAIMEMEHEVEKQIAISEAAISTPDPIRDERLRNRFDRSRLH